MASRRHPRRPAPDAAALRQALVEHLRATGAMRSPAVEAAFRAVPRHLFVPGLPVEQVYRDQAIVTKRLDGVPASSSSQPAIMAVMLEQLDVRPGQHVLEIGAGTGYNAALLGHLVGETGQVVSVDIDADLVRQARRHLARAGFERVHVVCGDGGLGYPEAAPYDRIILTVGAWDIAPAWREQLRPDGRLVLPLSIRGPESQKSIAFDPADGYLVSASVRDCGFMRLRGAFADPIQLVQLGPEPGLHLVVDNQPRPPDAGTVYAWLRGASRTWPTGVPVRPNEAFGGLNLWLALREPRFCALVAQAAAASRELVPHLYGGPSAPRSSVGHLAASGLSLLARPPEYQLPEGCNEWSDQAPRFEVEVRSFGPDARGGQHLVELVTAWHTAGRPTSQRLRVRAYPRDAAEPGPATGITIDKPWTRLVLDWS